MVHDRYGVFKVIMDGETIIDGGAAAFLGILPSGAKVLAAIRGRLKA